MKTTKLIYFLRKKFPKKNSLKKDYLGLQIGRFKKNTNKIAICLDFNSNVLKKIIHKNVDLVITHHPFIYGDFDNVIQKDWLKKKLVNKIEKLKIPIYSIHTNFDCSDEGMNVILAKKLGLKNIQKIKENKIIRGGTLKYSMTIKNFAKYVKKKLKIPHVYILKNNNKEIKKVAICAGSGADMFQIAQNNNYDIFCSGDAPQHIRNSIKNYKYNYLELFHEIEKVFIYAMKKIINKIDNKIKIYCIDEQRYPEII
ncbi:MAG: Nif3-like dinuclear metal center hexameric protein [Bacilli bacterium]|nr:Nif3-like dinuclear metal center hexameric protein [Bacilli bacterium]